MQLLVPLMLLLPLIGAIVVAVLGPRRKDAIRWISLGTTLAGLLIALVLAVDFARLRQKTSNGFGETSAAKAKVPSFAPELVTRFALLHLPGLSEAARPDEPTAIRFYVGIDGLNIWLIVLTALLMVSSVLISWTAIKHRVHEYYAWLLALGAGMTGVFAAFDLILFYAFFELTLVPLFFLIGIWGGPQRQYAARKFFIYTLTGSLVTLLGVLGVAVAYYLHNGYYVRDGVVKHLMTFDIPDLVRLINERLSLDPVEASVELAFWRNVQFWVFLAMMAGFAIKVPLFPLHTWLPLAHVEAPTAGSVLLAGVLLKIGAYGFLRLCLPLAPDASLSLGVPLIGTMAVIGIIYGALCALAQGTPRGDVKKLVAYSSVSHLGLCMLGMFALNEAGLSGSLLQMINHGLSTGALFLLVGMLYERYHTRRIGDYGGMAARLKLLSVFMVFICLSSVGLPGLNGFVGEVLVFVGIYDLRGSPVDGRALMVLATSGVVLGAWYLFTMLQRMFIGPVKEPQTHAEPGGSPSGDINGREIAALGPIAVVCVVLGVVPGLVLDASKPDLRVVAWFADQARNRAEASRQAKLSPAAVAEKGTEGSEDRP
ncbi:MAG TPA: NADH-quinone oxidoreductase subunit M [Gemmataceae bacterium]|nr:NADH-quinone oxidoreductase subunit M [Gemmataceae bacterium]